MSPSKKILLLNPPGDRLFQRDAYCSAVSKADYYWPPIDLLILSGILDAGFDVDVIDAIAEKKTPRQVARAIREAGYDAIVFLTSTASWRQDFAFLGGIEKSGKNRPLFIGNGDVLLYAAEEFFKNYPFLDAVLFDYTSPDIVHYLRGDHAAVNSMAFRSSGGLQVRKKEIRPEEFSYPVPRHDKFPLKRYLLAQGKRFPFTAVQTNFGCPFKCSFCVASTLGYKYRSVDNVMEELRSVAALGIREIFFLDFTFEARRKNVIELCRRINEERLDLSWTCSSRANTLDREILSRMKLAGCHTVLIGVESGDEDILVKYSKGVTKKDLKRAFSLCRAMGIRTLGHFIIGLPGETEQTVRKTLEFALELDCDLASFNIAVPALGTPLREDAMRNGWLQDNPLEFDSSASYPVIETPAFSKEQAWTWRNRAVRRFYFRPRYLFRKAVASYSPYQWRVLIRNGFALVKNFALKAVRNSL